MAPFRSMAFLAPIILIWVSASCLPVPKQEKAISGLNGLIEVRADKNWQVIHNLHQSADLQAGDPGNNQYLLIISEQKQRTRFKTKENYSQFTRGPLTSRLADAFVFGPKQVQVNGLPGIVYEIRGRSPQNSVIYLHAVLESPKYFHQIVLWTHEKKIKENREGMMKIIESFRENSPQSQN